MAETFRDLLAHEVDVGQLRDLLDGAQRRFFFRLALEILFQLECMVEVILDHALAAVGDDEDVLDPRSDSFLNEILDRGFVHDVEHFLRNGFGCGQYARAETCRRNDRFLDFLHVKTSRLLV